MSRPDDECTCWYDADCPYCADGGAAGVARREREHWDRAGHLQGTRDCQHVGEPSWPEHDARGIYLCTVCSKCEGVRLKGYRPDVLTDPQYWHDEPLDEPD